MHVAEVLAPSRILDSTFRAEKHVESDPRQSMGRTMKGVPTPRVQVDPQLFDWSLDVAVVATIERLVVRVENRMIQ